MPKRTFLVMVMAAIACMILPGSRAEAYTAAYTQTITSRTAAPVTMKIWMEDAKMRMETSAGEEKVVIITREDGIYNYIPSQNLITKIPEMGQRVDYVVSPDSYLGYIKSLGAVKEGSEKIGPYMCDIYAYRDAASQANVIVWVWQDQPFPVKMVVKSPYDTVEVRFSNIKINEPVPSGTFDLPSDATFIDTTKVPSLDDLLAQF